MTKCAHVAIIGRPNAGKSTLLNAILGEHLSIVTPKPQTTRRSVLGIHTDNNTQLIFVDTPGVLRPRYRLQKAMMQYVQECLESTDIICVVIDTPKAVEHDGLLDPMMEGLLKSVRSRSKVPIILVLNKMDALPQSKLALPLVEQARQSGLFTKSVAISASQGKEVDDLVRVLQDLAPESVYLYDEDQLSTLPQRFFVAELIREVIFKQLRQEVPYATAVQVLEFTEPEVGPFHITADITVERDTQKIIMIGKGGEQLKRIRMEAQQAIADHLQHGVKLELFVKVRADWRNDRAQLANLGY
ncbi:MAG: GTPase Era [Bradyrhizobiaceae bacterium]|nr:GTPase Era [Bradyrhizobiaceae bacterium]